MKIAISDIVDWLKKKPADEEYEFSANHGCLFAQYLNERGHKDVWVGGWTFEANGGRYEIPDEIQDIAETRPFTFGAALERASSPR